MASSSSSSYNSIYTSCFNSWLTQQHQDLEDLLHGSTSHPNDPDQLQALVDKMILHFEEYRENRSILSQQDPPAFLCPSWCSSIENSLLWIGGCRPSLAIRLVYSLCGSELNARLNRYLEGERKGDLSEISAAQMSQINGLHLRILSEEQRLSSRLASLQEDIVDEPLNLIANESSYVGEPSVRADRALVDHAATMGRIMAEADNLRMSTLKELVGILTPFQAVDMLISTKKLHLSLHEWGKNRDRDFLHILHPTTDRPSREVP